jgi:hypothetical protein
MTPSDLARWNIALMQGRILSPHSFRELTKEAHLDNGAGTKYALGFDVGTFQGLREISHDGSVIGGGCVNRAFPGISAAVTACENLGNNSNLSGTVTELAIKLIISTQKRTSEDELRPIRALLTGLRFGRIDANLMTANGRSYFDETVRRDYRKSLATLGKLLLLTPMAGEARGGMTRRVYRAEFEAGQAIIHIFVTSNGLYEQFMIFRQ